MKAGTTIGNHKTGETLTMLISEQDNHSALQYYRVSLPPHRQAPPLHFHTAFTETFTCEQGSLDLYLGKERKNLQLQPGEGYTVDISQPHTFSNNASIPCVMTVKTRPAGGVVDAFHLAYGIANDGGAAADGLPRNPLLRLRFIGISQGYLPQIPLALQKFLFAVAKSLASITGAEKRVQHYLAE